MRNGGYSIMDNSRPIMITIIAVLLLIGVVALLALGTYCMVDPAAVINASSDASIDESAVRITGIVLMVLGAILAGIIYGILKGWSFMWYLTVLMAVVCLLGSVFGLLASIGAIAGVIIFLIVLYYMFRSPVKEYFGVNRN